MSTTSTNSRPLLIDRPWSSRGYFTSKSILSLTDVNLAGMELLLDGTAPNFDGALLDTVVAVNHAPTPEAIALFLAFNGSVQSFTADLVVPVAWQELAAAPAAGLPARVELELPTICVPVPAVAMGPAGEPSAGRNRGLWIARGVRLFAARISPGATALVKGVQVLALGGLY